MRINFPRLCFLALLLWVSVLSAAWSHPGSGIVVDAKGQVYFVHGIRNRIMKLSPAGKLTTFVDGTKDEKLVNPHHLVLDKDGNLYSVGDNGGRVWKMTPDGNLTLVYPPREGPGIGAIGLGGDPFTMDAAGNIYCTFDRQFNYTQILKIGRDGRLANLAGGDWGHADGKGGSAQFRSLHSGAFAWTKDGALLVTDNGSGIRRITPDGSAKTLAGGRDDGFADGTLKESRFRGAMGMAVDARGNIFVADGGNRRIRKISADGKVSTLAGSGKRGGQDGPALEANFEDPCGVAVAANGTVYVLDYVGDNPRVRKLGVDGRVSSVAMTKNE